MASNESSQPNLSQYFGNASEPQSTAKEEFFDNFNDAMMQSCRESKIDLTGMVKKVTPPVEAEIVVTTQVSTQCTVLDWVIKILTPFMLKFYYLGCKYVMVDF